MTLEEKSKEVLNELNAKAEEDLKVVQKIEFGNDKKDVEIVSEVKGQLQNLLDQLNNNRENIINGANKDLDKFNILIEILEKSKEIPKYVEVCEKQLNAIHNNIKSINEYIANYEQKIALLKLMLEKYFDFKVTEDGKCYIPQETIDFARLMKEIAVW